MLRVAARNVAKHTNCSYCLSHVRPSANHPRQPSPCQHHFAQDAANAIRTLLPLDAVTAETTLGEVLQAVTEHHHHRVYVVDAQGKAVGVVSLTDLLRVVSSN